MNPQLIAAGLNLLNNFSMSNDSDSRKEQTVKEIFSVVDESRKFWQRKTWWAMIIAVLVPILNKATGLDMDVVAVTAVVTPLVAFILSEGWRKRGV